MKAHHKRAFIMQANASDTITPREAAGSLKRSIPTLERWRRLRIGPPFYRVCGRVLYSRADIAAWIESQKHAPSCNGGAQ